MAKKRYKHSTERESNGYAYNEYRADVLVRSFKAGDRIVVSDQAKHRCGREQLRGRTGCIERFRKVYDYSNYPTFHVWMALVRFDKTPDKLTRIECDLLLPSDQVTEIYFRTK